jgi:carbohydrate binding protein with CBM6 domain
MNDCIHRRRENRISRHVSCSRNRSQHIQKPGTYVIEANVSSVYTNSQFRIEIDGEKRTDSVLVPNTGSWTSYQWVGAGGIELSAGPHILRIYVEQECFDLDALRVP